MVNISLLTARVLAFLLLVGGLLTPYHMAPWRSAFQEFAVLFATLFFCISLAVEKDSLKLPSLKWLLVACGLGLFGLLIFASGNPIQTESHYLFLTYVVAIYLAVAAGSLCTNRSTVKITLCAALALVAIGQIASSVQQWVGSVTTISFDNWWSTTGSAGQRANGNIFQSNNYGTLVIWGYLAWLFVSDHLERKQRAVSRFTLLLLAVFFSFGLVLGQSRTSILSLAVVTFLGVINAHLFSKCIRFAWVSFLVGVALFWFLQPIVANYLFTELSGATVAEVRGFNGQDLRLPAWAMFLSAATDSMPHLFLGRGWGSIRSVHAEMAGSSVNLPALGMHTFAHTHNIFLDVLVSFGLIGLAIFTYLMWKVVRHFLSQQRASQDFYLWAMLIALFVHANLELPHWYGYFVWPAAFIYGVMVRPSGGCVLHPKLALTALIAILGVSIFAFVRYLDFEKAYSTYAIQFAQRGRIVEVIDLDTGFFPGLREVLNVSSINVSQELTTYDYDRLVQVATFSTSSLSVSRAYYASVFMKDLARYQYFSKLACRVFGFDFAARIHTISMTIPVEMERRKVQSDCNFAPA